MSAAKHTPRPWTLEAELFWAERHANDMTIAEHNRRHFAAEVVRLRAAIAKATGSEQ